MGRNLHWSLVPASKDFRPVSDSKKPVAGRGPPVGGRNEVISWLLEGSGRWISGGGNPVKKRGPWGCCALESGDALRRSRSGS